MVCNAVVEMRRYYSRKVIDVLIKVIRATLDTIRKRFHNDDEIGVAAAAVVRKPIFVLSATLMIPQITIKPTLEELQEHLITVGKNITGIAKGVAQWSSGKDSIQVNGFLGLIDRFYWFLVGGKIAKLSSLLMISY